MRLLFVKIIAQQAHALQDRFYTSSKRWTPGALPSSCIIYIWLRGTSLFAVQSTQSPLSSVKPSFMI